METVALSTGEVIRILVGWRAWLLFLGTVIVISLAAITVWELSGVAARRRLAHL